jgi:putative Ca2+/H+ antiporter (TMEM165/GDT1 family)
MDREAGVGEEMREVEQELEEKEHDLARRDRKLSNPHSLESGRLSSRSSSPSKGGSPHGAAGGLTNLFSLLLSPAWVQTFVMTFLGEWGDRSQIATIAMAAGQDYWWVTLGAITGHACCTGLAVLGGRALAGKVSMRVGKFRAAAGHTITSTY